MDVETRELVYALIVAAEAQGPLVTRTFEMEIPVRSPAALQACLHSLPAQLACTACLAGRSGSARLELVLPPQASSLNNHSCSPPHAP